MPELALAVTVLLALWALINRHGPRSTVQPPPATPEPPRPPPLPPEDEL